MYGHKGGDIQLEEKIIKKINYAIITFKHNGNNVKQLVYGKSNINKTIKDIVEQYQLVNSANIDVKIITERRAITLPDFLEHSEVL